MDELRWVIIVGYFVVGIIISAALGREDGKEDSLAQQGALVFGWPILAGLFLFWLIFAIPGWAAQELRRVGKYIIGRGK